MVNYSKPSVVSHRKSLSRSQFEQICCRAARNSKTCGQYIRRVLRHLCHWLRTPDEFESLCAKETAGRRNIQLTVITLYNLLEKRCRYDFDVAEVLNSCSDTSGESYR
jgi:hypothetical protein